jgi:hypothetical protein
MREKAKSVPYLGNYPEIRKKQKRPRISPPGFPFLRVIPGNPQPPRPDRVLNMLSKTYKNNNPDHQNDKNVRKIS